MALGYTMIDYEALKTAVTELRNIQEDLGKTLSMVKNDIDTTANSPDVYLSREAESCKNRFNEMYSNWAKKFTNYVQEYIDFFEEAGKTYHDTGDVIKGNDTNLNSFIG